MKRSVAIILALIMTAAVFAGCDGSDVTTDSVTAEMTGPDTETDVPEAKPAGLINVGGTPISEFTVVVPDEAGSRLAAAADDLVRLVKLAAGCTLPTASSPVKDSHSIILGTTPADTDNVRSARAEVKNDGYALLQEGGNLYITGISEAGTANGVYDFLQNYLGLRFYSGTFTFVREDGAKDVAEGERVVFNPTFLYRNDYGAEVLMNINNFLIRTKGYGPMPGGVGGPHNLGPRSGKGGATDPQPCFSDPEVYETVLKSVYKNIKEDATGPQVINVCQNDNNTYCKCEQCAEKDEAAGSHMGAQLMFINNIARDVKEKYPDLEIYILTLAYQYSEDVPDPSVVKPEDNVIIELCLINACFTHPFDDPECSTNVKSYKNIEGWSKVCDKLYIWDYAVCDSSQNHPGPNLDVLWDNMQCFKNNHVIGQFQNSFGYETGEFGELRQYLIGRLLWDPGMSREQFNKLRAEFMEDYYGAAAPYISEYIDLMNANSRKTGITAWNGHTAIWTDDKVFYTPQIDGKKSYETINKCSELWEKALSCTLDDVTFSHVEKSSLHFREWESKYAEVRKVKRTAGEVYKHLCDKYTYDYDESLPDIGPVEGFSTEIPSEGLQFRSYGDGTAYVSDIGDFRAGMLVIPTEHDGEKVTAVGQSALRRGTNIIEVHVPEGIEKIGTYAFASCANMKAIYLPSTLETLGYGALEVFSSGHYGNPELKDIYYAGTKEKWNLIYEENNGIINTLRECTVHCTDGDVGYEK